MCELFFFSPTLLLPISWKAQVSSVEYHTHTYIQKKRKSLINRTCSVVLAPLLTRRHLSRTLLQDGAWLTPR